ncbi:hypothetical protein Acr_22g0006580 [Actinidia rufa]|uniref:Uncharacterized protein n=1 Tax=Actinidia rufa TaxID=165716 RepID=A0A7J0GKE7_9ERIC|nr:hypothetical protein Acr_22g0006580 [Actinidia rufa]
MEKLQQVLVVVNLIKLATRTGEGLSEVRSTQREYAPQGKLNELRGRLLLEMAHSKNAKKVPRFVKSDESAPMGGDPKKRNQRWKYALHKEKWHKTEGCKGIEVFLGSACSSKELKEFIDQEKTEAKKAKVRPKPRFDRGNDEADDALTEDLPLGTIHMIRGPNHPDPRRDLHHHTNVPSMQPLAKKPSQGLFDPGSNAFTKLELSSSFASGSFVASAPSTSIPQSSSSSASWLAYASSLKPKRRIGEYSSGEYPLVDRVLGYLLELDQLPPILLSLGTSRGYFLHCNGNNLSESFALLDESCALKNENISLGVGGSPLTYGGPAMLPVVTSSSTAKSSTSWGNMTTYAKAMLVSCSQAMLVAKNLPLELSNCKILEFRARGL